MNSNSHFTPNTQNAIASFGHELSAKVQECEETKTPQVLMECSVREVVTPMEGEAKEAESPIDGDVAEVVSEERGEVREVSESAEGEVQKLEQAKGL